MMLPYPIVRWLSNQLAHLVPQCSVATRSRQGTLANPARAMFRGCQARLSTQLEAGSRPDLAVPRLVRETRASFGLAQKLS